MKTNIPSDIVKLIAGHIRGNNTPEQEKMFAEWLSVPGNDGEYGKALKIWEEIAAEDGGYAEAADRAWAELGRRLEEGRKKSRGRVVRILGGTAAAAAVALAAIFGYSLAGISGTEPVSFANVSGKSRVVLPDGSDVTLGAGSSLSYDKSFGRKSRNVQVSGRAFFDVAKDRNRPFTVETGGLKIKVHGTRFDVESEADRVTVSLVEGCVSLFAGDGNRGQTMSAGEVATYDRKNGDVRISSGDVRSSMLWSFDRLSFSDATLDKVCHDLSLWYGVNVVLSENLYGKGCINFTITDESLDSVLSIIGRTTRVNYRFEGPKSVIVY